MAKLKREYVDSTNGFENGQLVYVVYNGQESKAAYRLVKNLGNQIIIEVTEQTRKLDGDFISGWPGEGRKGLDPNKYYWQVCYICKANCYKLLKNE